MLIERPPGIFRLLFPIALFRVPKGKRSAPREVYLTFDDGPVPEVTPKVLDILDRYGVHATFFMVGDNVRRHPELLEEVRRRGHAVGNHTFHHLQGAHVTTKRYLRDIMEAHKLIGSPLFRPPHGWMRPRQARAMRKVFTPVMYDLWANMLKRCYHDRTGATVDPRWHSFRCFLDTIHKVPGFAAWEQDTSMHLDKDIRVPGNLVYSVETCTFVSAAENVQDCLKRRWAKA